MSYCNHAITQQDIIERSVDVLALDMCTIVLCIMHFILVSRFFGSIKSIVFSISVDIVRSFVLALDGFLSEIATLGHAACEGFLTFGGDLASGRGLGTFVVGSGGFAS